MPRCWRKETAAGEPRPAMYVTGVVGLATLIFGLSGNGLNRIAPLMTMFFLITYVVLNAVVLLEQSLGLTSFRPQLPIPKAVPLIGLIGGLIAMFLINPLFSLAAIVTTFLLYEGLLLRHLTAPWSDVRSGMFVTLAEWAAKRVLDMPSGQDRAWKPRLLIPLESTAALRRSYRFLTAITQPNGSMHILGSYTADAPEQVAGLPAFEPIFSHDGIFARVALVESDNFLRTLQTAIGVLHSAFFRPNTLFWTVMPETEEAELAFVLALAAQNELGVIFFVDNPLTALGREHVINVWIREQSPDWEVGLRLSNLDLALLLAYQLARNWNGQMNLITVVADEAERVNGERFLQQLIDLGRMPRQTQALVKVGTFNEHLPQAPQADLNIFGVQQTADKAFMYAMTAATASTCIFVSDSGQESALA
ncbi:MAG: hypothetical protein R3A44_25480 [Caldilineaceae bacterium]